MTHTLESYKLNLVKTGIILQELRNSRKMSRALVADSIGVTTDIISNIEKGLGGLSFERMLKLCVLYEVPMIAIVMLITKDEDITFRDGILVYDHKKDTITPVTDNGVPDVPAVLPDAVVEAAASAPDVVSVLPPAPLPEHYSREELRALLDRMEHAHAAHVADLREQLARQDQIIRQLIDKR